MFANMFLLAGLERALRVTRGNTFRFTPNDIPASTQDAFRANVRDQALIQSQSIGRCRKHKATAVTRQKIVVRHSFSV